tara:strand:+ start:54 stop:767 length:714 start_codon:yes stop_codon:yes gene_type:complete
MFRLDPESIAESQIDSYKPGKGRQKEIGDRLGDFTMWLLTGGQIDYAKEVDRLTKEKYIEKLEEPYGTSKINKADRVTGYEKLGDLGNYTPLELKRALLEREGTRSARNKTATLTGQDPSEFATLTDPGEIEAAGARFIIDKRESDLQIERGRQDASVARVEAEKARQFDNNLALQRRQIEANISARQENIDLSRLKLQMDQNRYMYEADTRRQDIREQRIAALTEALAGLGAAFVI